MGNDTGTGVSGEGPTVQVPRADLVGLRDEIEDLRVAVYELEAALSRPSGGTSAAVL